MKTLVSALLAAACLSMGCRQTEPISDADAMVNDDASIDAGPDAGAEVGADAGVGTCVRNPVVGPGTDVIEDPNGRAQVVVHARDACLRSYTLSTTASLRGGEPPNPREIVEEAGAPTTRTGNDMFDALHALALGEVAQLSVSEIRDGSFDAGNPITCPQGGCFETGRLWNYVWTRDTAYAADLGLVALDPTRTRNSLEFKLSERRTGGDLQIVQDTGSGGSYPVSTDRVVWAVGARALLDVLRGAERDAFAARTLEALTNTIEQDRRVVFDPTDGLYRGEQSFLDWREQSYPEWTADDTVHIAMSKALSTNVLHYAALELAGTLAADAGDAARGGRYRSWAEDLRTAIRTRFWLESEGLFSTFTTTELDPAPTRRFDLLGSALAVLLGVADDAQSARILASYPHYGPAAPVIWPQQQNTPIYHNRAEWPFVDATWLRAAARVGNDAVANRMVAALMRGAALNLSNMENFDASRGANWVEEGATSGPVINSQRQLWSVAGYLAMVHRVLFGLRATPAGLHVSPYVTAGIREALFAASDELVLNDYPFAGHRVTVVIHLPPTGDAAGAYGIDERRFNGELLSDSVVADDMFTAENRIDVVLGAVGPAATLTERSDADWRDVFGPRTPRITSVVDAGGHPQLTLDRGGESESLTFSVYRDGTEVASGLDGSTTTWTDDSIDAAGPASPCYAVEACLVSSGNCSQHSPPMCWWGSGGAHVQSIDASSFAATGGTASNDHGRFHYDGWGDVGHRLEVSSFTPTETGRHLLQVVYGNGAGDVATGITCAVKRLTVEDVTTGTVLAEGALVMPHLGTWDRWADSNFVGADLEAGRPVRIVIASDPDYPNMSAFAHFARYDGEGGSGGEFNRVNIAELKILSRP